MSAPDFTRAALDYANRFGFRVFPLHSPDRSSPTGCDCNSRECDSPAKHPRTLNGVKDATTDAEQIALWGRMWPHANVGIATGGPGHLVVLDVDPRHGGDESLRDLELEHGALRPTPTVLTGGGGMHLHMVLPEGMTVRNTAGVLGPGLDIRTEGGYVVAPPSMHVSGQPYEWASDAHIDDVPLAPMPSWMVDLLVQDARQPAPCIDGRISKGARNTTLASFAGTMRRRGISEAGILACLEVENEMRCEPPLPASEVRRIVRSISGYPPDDDGHTRVIGVR